MQNIIYIMSTISKTPKPPYYAVIFTSLKIPEDQGYSKMSDRMVELVSQQDGFLGFESAREELGITVSYHLYKNEWWTNTRKKDDIKIMLDNSTVN
jgi:hypothetical protein